MLRLLFPRLTADPVRGGALFQWVAERAREPHWYLDGEVPDTVDGRFAMLSTVAALVLIRLERDGESGIEASVALTERFVETMTAEHREMGIGDPTLGKTVRKLVGALSRRVDLWRTSADWAATARESAYGSVDPQPDALEYTATRLSELSKRIESTPLAAVAEGEIV